MVVSVFVFILVFRLFCFFPFCFVSLLPCVYLFLCLLDCLSISISACLLLACCVSFFFLFLSAWLSCLLAPLFASIPSFIYFVLSFFLLVWHIMPKVSAHLLHQASAILQANVEVNEINKINKDVLSGPPAIQV